MFGSLQNSLTINHMKDKTIIILALIGGLIWAVANGHSGLALFLGICLLLC
jgi:hypothetical protein